MDKISDGSLIPHGYCLSWDPWLLTAFVIGNVLIAVAYFTIPFVILRFIRQRNDIDYQHLHWLFAGFIITCGITHSLHVVELWYPAYYLEAFFDLLTAAISVVAAVILWRILPTLVNLPSMNQLLSANTELNKMDGVLRERELQLRSLGDSLPDSYLYEYTIEDDKPQFLYVSSGVQRLHGIKPELVLLDAAVLLGQIDPAQRGSYLQAETERRRDMTDFSMELRMLRADGEWRWMQLRSRPRKRADGRVVWDGIATDITDRHLFEAEINRLAQAIEQNPTGILITNAQGELEYMNTACSRMTGYQFAQSINRTRREIISTEMSDAEFAEINARIEAGKQWGGQLQNRRRDGSLYWEQINASPIYDNNGKVANYMYLRLDISEQKKAEAELLQRSTALARANADLTRFADVSAHHLMEPTRRLATYAQQLRPRLEKLPELQQDGEALNSLATLEREADRLRNLVRDIQLYLAASQPRGELRMEDANAVCQALQKHYAGILSNTGAVLRIGELPAAYIDHSRLSDLFNVLLENALKHGRPLDASTQFQIDISGERGNKLSRYRVSDSGPGIPAEYRERVFGIFERMSSSGESSGIGLSIAKRIVESCMGNIWIDSSAQGGVMVIFELPDKEQA